MKYHILFCLLMASNFLTFSQNRVNDEKQINQQIDVFIASWNNHDFNDIHKSTTTNVDWVNIVGNWYKGQAENKTHLEELHQSIFKEVAYTKHNTNIRFITKNVAVVHVSWSLGAFYPPDGVDRGNNKVAEDIELGTLVMVKESKKCLITAAHNSKINTKAQESNAINFKK